MPKLMTAAEGAADERRLWMRKVRDIRKESIDPAVHARMDQLLAYGEGRTKRNAVKAGGQGRK